MYIYIIIQYARILVLVKESTLTQNLKISLNVTILILIYSPYAIH